MIKKLESFFDHQESPLLNGIIFPNGKAYLLDIEIDWSSSRKYLVTFSKKIFIDEIDDLLWSDCKIIEKIYNLEKKLILLAGEGDYGSDGFFSIIDEPSKKLIWMLYSDCSDPFNSIKIEDDMVCASSTNNTKWIFNLNDPLIFTIG